VDSDGTRVLLSGSWSDRPKTSRAADAAVTWDLPVLQAGTCEVLIRYPGGTTNPPTTDASLVVAQGSGVLLHVTVNQQQNPWRWQTVGTVQVSAGTPCRVILGQPPGPPDQLQRLVFIEARLQPR
jgi:hypothetical protein